MASLDYGQHFTAHHITTVKDAGTTMTVENTQGSGTQQTKITRALISVYDKTGLEDLARGLAKAGVEIVSTGSTAKVIADAGVEVTPVENVTEFPECFDGRVKTLHPRVHGGILADRTKQKHRDQLNELGIAPFDLVVVNLYPFEETVASGANVQECIEKIDIGGPAMVRAAAKNHDSVAVVVDPANYDVVQRAAAGAGFSLEERRQLALEAFTHTSKYDLAVSSWMLAELVAEAEEKSESELAQDVPTTQLRYGENPHQAAYLERIPGAGGVANAKQLHGKEMSFNNYQDAEAAWRAAHDHQRACVAIIKHANPCGIAVSDESIAQAHSRAHACDPVSAFGGVIATNRPVSVEMAHQVAEVFTEVILAPGYEDGAVEVLQGKKNIRILQVEDASLVDDSQQTASDASGEQQLSADDAGSWDSKVISGGVLFQEPDRYQADGDQAENWKLVAGAAVDDEVLADLEFAWRAVRSVKSNAIVLSRESATVGVGMGQVNRVDSARLAVERANTLGDDEQRANGSVAASDAFFPFADGLEVLLDAGVKAVVSPGGSIRDEEVIAAAEKAGVALYFTGTRHFFH